MSSKTVPVVIIYIPMAMIGGHVYWGRKIIWSQDVRPPQRCSAYQESRSQKLSFTIISYTRMPGPL